MDTFVKNEVDNGDKATHPKVALQAVNDAIQRAQGYLLSLQKPQGYWVGELEADASVSAGYIPLMYFMLGSVDRKRSSKVINYVRSKQNADGSWPSYFGGPGDLSATIQVYFALKLAGVSAEEPYMRQARQFVLDNGGVSKANVITKLWLALFGQYDWRGTPTIPPEIVLLPNWFYFNIYEFASWSRATIVALTVISALKPVCRVPDRCGVAELFVEAESQRDYSLSKIEKLFDWGSFFLVADSIFKLWERMPIKPGRRLALNRVQKWILEHQERDGSWGGIMLPWVYSLMALKSLGYPLDHPAIARGLAGLEGFIVEDDSFVRLQPATSPVWDTAWAVIALRESGLSADHPALVGGARWLLEKEIRVGGDWQVKNPNTEPGCWSFEFENDLYPDMDDTALVARALQRVDLPAGELAKAHAIDRAVRWIESMQSNDGGWAAFDLNNDKQFLAHVPFADFMTPLDPTCADVTAHVVELLGELGGSGSKSVEKAIDYLRRTQEADGSWYGRWGVNYLYGTGLVLAALRSVGNGCGQEYVSRAATWLVSKQNHDGGWGESCHSYKDPRCKGAGISTASQTAWVVLGLISVGEGHSLAVSRGIEYLLRSQREDGSWREDQYTGTGFPKAFYLKYDLYRIYFPLLALARYRDCLEGVLPR